MYRQCGLAYVVAFANGGAKDVTRRYIGHMPYTQKLRDSKWFKHLLAHLHKAEVRQAPAGLDLQLQGVQAPTGPLRKAEVRQTPADCDKQLQVAAGMPETAALHQNHKHWPCRAAWQGRSPAARLLVDSSAAAACSCKFAGM